MNYESFTKFSMNNQDFVRILSNSHGICLTELLVSLATGAIVLAATLSTFTIVQAHANKQHHTLNHQQDLRLGLEVFEQEARLATADSIATVTPDEFLFHANLSAHRTITTGVILPGQSVLAVQDGSGWGEGKTILVCGPQVCESHRLSRAGQRYQLTLAEPVGSAFPSGASVEVQNRVTYYVKRDVEGTSKLMRQVDGGASVLIGGLDDLRFSYWDEMGKGTNQPSKVKRVVLEINSNQPLHSMVRVVSVRS
jgi:type II secretory pathway component PulJ